MEQLPPLVTAVAGDAKDETNKSAQQTERTTTSENPPSPNPVNLPRIPATNDFRNRKLPSRSKLGKLEIGKRKNKRCSKKDKKSPERSKPSGLNGASNVRVPKSATGNDDESVSSFSSGSSSYYSQSDSEEDELTPNTVPSSPQQPLLVDQTAATKLNAAHQDTITKTASATTLSILSAATASAKLRGLKKHLEADLAGNGRHVLITKSATIPHIHITVDATTAREIDALALKEQPHKPTQTAKSSSQVGAPDRLLRVGVPTEMLENVQAYIEGSSAPGFAKKTVAGLINERHHHA